MKKIFLLIFTAIFIFSCNDGSNLKETQSDKMTEEEKVKFEKLQNMSPDEMKALELLKSINSYDNTFFEYNYRYSMYFRIKRGVFYSFRNKYTRTCRKISSNSNGKKIFWNKEFFKEYDSK